MNVRTALLYRKNLSTLIEESVRAPPNSHSLLLLNIGGPTEHRIPPTLGSYILDGTHCTVALPPSNAMLRLWVLGSL